MRYAIEILSSLTPITGAADREEITGRTPTHPVDHVVVDNKARHPRERIVCYANRANARLIADELNGARA